MLSPPVVVMTTDDDLAVGEFGIATRMIQQRARQDGPPVPSAEPAQTMVYRPTEPRPTIRAPTSPVRPCCSWTARRSTRSRSP